MTKPGVKFVNTGLTVKVGPHNYEVIESLEAILKANRVEQCSVLGVTDSSQQTITIDPSQGPSSYRVTLFHELGHAVCDLLGLTWDEDEEESFVAKFMPMVLMVLRDNPLLVSVLLDEVKT